MTYQDRIELYKEIESIRDRPLISYVTSLRPNAGGAIASDVISEFAKQINQIPLEENKVDLLLISNGGDALISWRIICMLRERFSEIGALLPYAAYSAATLIALGANEIIMHPFSNLGPVDPQLSYSKEVPKEGQPQKIRFASEDIRHYLKFLRENVGITDQRELSNAFETICKDIGTIPIGVASRVSYLSHSLSKKLLNTHMNDPNETQTIVDALNKSFYDHGYPVGRSEAKDIGLKVNEPESELENLIWGIWEDFEEDMECNNTFNPIEIVFNDDDLSEELRKVPSATNIPQNLPPQIQKQIYQGILNSISIKSIKPVDFEVFVASLESLRCKSEYRKEGIINAVRMPNMKIGINLIDTKQGWQFYSNNEEN